MKGKVVLNRKWGYNNVHTGQYKLTYTYWEITELSFSANRKGSDVERERSHWNGRTNYTRCLYVRMRQTISPISKPFILNNDVQNKHTHA